MVYLRISRVGYRSFPLGNIDTHVYNIKVLITTYVE